MTSKDCLDKLERLEISLKKNFLKFLESLFLRGYVPSRAKKIKVKINELKEELKGNIGANPWVDKRIQCTEVRY